MEHLHKYYCIPISTIFIKLILCIIRHLFIQEKEKEREKSKSKKEKKEREKKNKELEQKKTKEGDTKKDKKNKKNKEDQSQTDTNHLQVRNIAVFIISSSYISSINIC